MKKDNKVLRWSVIVALAIPLGLIVWIIDKAVESGAVWWILGSLGFIFVIVGIIFLVKFIKKKKGRQRYNREYNQQIRKYNETQHSKYKHLIELKKKIIECEQLVSLGKTSQEKLNVLEEEYARQRSKTFQGLNFMEKKSFDSEEKLELERIKSCEEKKKQRQEERIKRLIIITKTFEKFEQNEILIKIVSNFLIQNEVKNVELYAIPKRNSGIYFKPDYILEDLETTQEYNFDKIKYTLLSAYNKRQIEKSILQNYLLETKNEKVGIEEVEFLFSSLKNQKIISQHEQKQAFYFLISEKQREKRLKLYNDLCEQYDIKVTDDDEKIIKNLYLQDKMKAEIDAIIALRYYAIHIDKLYEDCFVDAQKTTQKSIEDIKQKKYIDNLLSGEMNVTTLSEIDLMNGYEFENFVANLFNKMGYETEVTKSSGDQGVDVLARKNDYLVAIQAKCYSGVVGNYAIQEVVAGMRYYKADKCMVITNSTFTRSARELAETNNVELWDRQVLKEKMEEI